MMTDETSPANKSLAAREPQENLQLKALLQDLALSHPVEVILDLDTVCGMDLFTAKIVFPGAKIFAVTAPEDRLNVKSKVDQFLSTNIEKDCLPFPSNTVDIVLADKTFSKVKETLWLIHEVTRSLRVGGYLILAMPKLKSEEQANGKEINLNSVSGIQTFLNLGYAAGYEWTSMTKNKYEAFPKWLARFINAVQEKRKPTQFLILRKVLPYTTGYLDYKINSNL